MTPAYLYRKCQCRVWPLAPMEHVNKCRTCGVKPEEVPDYNDYVELRLSRARIVQTVLATKDKALIKAMYDVW